MAETRTPLALWFERSGHKQKDIAATLEIHESYMSLLVSGQRQPSLELAIRIATLTGIPASDLLMREEPA